MRGFFWPGPCLVEAQGAALVAWETICRSVSQGELGVHHLQHANLALLTKWVCHLLTSSGDLVSVILQDGYGASLDWHKWQTLQRGDSAFMSSLCPIFSVVQSYFPPKLGCKESFQFWMEEWSGNARLRQSFPRLFTLASDLECSVHRA